MNPEILESELKRIDERVSTRRKASHPTPRTGVGGWKEAVRRNHFGLMAALIAVGALVVMIVPIVLILEVTSVKPAAAQQGSVNQGNEDATSRSNPSPSIPGDRGSAVALLTPEPPAKTLEDPIENLLDRIQRRRFSAPEEVADGQFLRGFPVLVHEIDDIDLSKLRPRRRGVGWTVVSAQSRTDQESGKKPNPERAMQVRCERNGDSWKVEQLIAPGGNLDTTIRER